MSTKIIDVDELKILLTLNGNRRIPHLEEEIAESDVLSGVYTERLWEQGAGIPLAQVAVNSVPYSAYQYARDILKSRWTFAENIILTGGCGVFSRADVIYSYSLYVIQDRWREAEPILKKDAYWFDRYCNYWLITSEQDPQF